MNAQCSGNEGEANSAECGDKVDKAQRVQVGQLRQQQLSDPKIDDELLERLATAAVRSVRLCNCLQPLVLSAHDWVTTLQLELPYQ